MGFVMFVGFSYDDYSSYIYSETLTMAYIELYLGLALFVDFKKRLGQ